MDLSSYKKTVSATDYPVKDNNLNDQLSLETDLADQSQPAYQFGQKRSTTSGLTYGYFGGVLNVDGVPTTIADGTIALTGSATNYVERDHAGTVSKNTTGFSADKVPMAQIATGVSSITTVTDKRPTNLPPVGRLSKSVAGGAGTTVLTADEARPPILEFTGALTGNRTIEVPAVKREWIVYNNTTGAFYLTVKVSGQTGVVVTQGKRAALYCDGTDVRQSNTDANEIGGAFSLTGDISPAQITADQNDYNPTGLSTASVLRLQSDAARSITGIAGGTNGRVLILQNIGSQPIILSHDSVGSVAGNRFYLPNGQPQLLQQYRLIVVRYDGPISRWYPLAATDGEYRTVQAFTGSGTWTKPAGLKRIKVTLVGGGGGGGGTPAPGASQGAAAAGGGGGGYSIKTIAGSSLGATETVTIGAAGAGGAAGANNGGTGGTSSFGAHCSATGGGGGGSGSVSGNSGPDGANSSVMVGGVGSGGDINGAGQGGGFGSRNIVDNVVASGTGGSSLLGGGAHAVSGAGGAPGSSPSGGYGGGGGGARSGGNEVARAGGNGVAGIVIVEEFF